MSRIIAIVSWFSTDRHRTIEGNLNAIAKTPKLNRSELLAHVFLPELIRLNYHLGYTGLHSSQALDNLSKTYQELDPQSDPYIIQLQADPETRDCVQLRKALSTGKTYCSEQVKKLLNKSSDISTELGAWAAEYFIHAVTEKFCSKGEDLLPAISELDEAEKRYLETLLLSVCRHGSNMLLSEHDMDLSLKARCLIDFLSRVDTQDFTGLIFVKTRATCAVLAHLLSMHWQTKERFRISTFVGMSTSINRKLDISEIVDVRNQKATLDHLRSGQKNLVISTSVLEEGIDVSACNVVICFEKPPNLKSFIQRRGRARKSKSKYVLMFPEDDRLNNVLTWQQLEETMKQRYMDDMRQLKELEELEEAEDGYREFKVESTGYVWY